MTIKTLKQPSFNKDSAKTKLDKAFMQLEKNINSLNQKAEKSNIYIQINETKEKEKIINKLFPFMSNTSFNLINYHNKQNELINAINKEYNYRIETALNCIGFISLNEKTKIIKCKPNYSLHLYPLNHIAKFETNLNDTSETSESIEQIKKYVNGNIEFKFKNDLDYSIFSELVFYNNDLTEHIINNTPKDIIEDYKAKCKEKHFNQSWVIYEWVEHDQKHISPPNFNLINKCWGV